MPFPRDDTPPTQSSKYWAREKDRYIRQLLIQDISKETNRPLIVYYSSLMEGITHDDSDDVSEIIEGIDNASKQSIDLLIHTPGGGVDAVEKFITVLKQRVQSYRVIIPGIAKSGGTVIALSSERILLGVNSEMGPIDPQMMVNGVGQVPCEIISNDESIPYTARELAKFAVKRMKAMAQSYLKDGMLKEKGDEEIKKIVEKISSPDGYKSHGAVIDYSEAESIGLSVEFLDPESSLWRKIWLLKCLYDHDMMMKKLGKICEGEKYSIARQQASN